MASLFLRDGDTFHPTEWSLGTWGPDLLHGGPPAALLAHAIEPTRDDPALVFGRLTVDLFRPVRLAPLTTSVQVVRPKGRLKLVDAFLHQGDQVVARASCLMLRSNPENPAHEVLPQAVPHWDTLQTHTFVQRDHPTFTQATRGRKAVDPATGRVTTLWLMLDADLLPGRPLTPFEYAAALSDYASPLGSMAGGLRPGFINADITLNLHRDMEGRWLALQGPGRIAHLGVGTHSAQLYDERGPLGSAAVCNLANA